MQKSQRLIQMMMRVNAKKSFTVKELAEEFGLSSRTITRDLQELSEIGVPIYSIQGRGGGISCCSSGCFPRLASPKARRLLCFLRVNPWTSLVLCLLVRGQILLFISSIITYLRI